MNIAFSTLNLYNPHKKRGMLRISFSLSGLTQQMVDRNPKAIKYQ